MIDNVLLWISRMNLNGLLDDDPRRLVAMTTASYFTNSSTYFKQQCSFFPAPCRAFLQPTCHLILDASNSSYVFSSSRSWSHSVTQRYRTLYVTGKAVLRDTGDQLMQIRLLIFRQVMFVGWGGTSKWVRVKMELARKYKYYALS